MLLSSKVKVNIFNPYLQLQVVTGLLNKMAMLALGLMGGCCFRLETVIGLVIGILVLVLIIID